MFSLDPGVIPSPTLEYSRIARWRWIVATDELSWSSGQADIYARPLSEVTSSVAWDALIHPQDRARVREAATKALETETAFREQFRIQGKGGATLWIFSDATILRLDGRAVGLAGINMEVTEWVDQMAASEARFRATFELAAVGMAHIGRDGTWLDVNRRCCEIVGYSKQELLKKTFFDITHPDDLNEGADLLRKFLHGELSSYSIEKRYLAKAGRIVWAAVTISKASKNDGSVNYFIAVIEDITARKQIEFERDALIEALEKRVQERTARLEQLSMTDSLTGIGNRRALDDHLAKEWRWAVRAGQPISAILVDIDCFKELNDTLGHPAGDRVLIALAEVLAKIPRRPADFAARYGGDEFMLILPNTDAKGALRVAEKISGEVARLALANPGSSVCSQVTLSQGIACTFPSIKGSGTDLTLVVDRALYAAKRKGRNQIAVAEAGHTSADI